MNKPYGMRTMDENFKKATRSLDALKTEGEYEDVLIARTLMAQAQATLALAYEQRTANLITLFEHADSAMAFTGNYDQLAEQIKERLGL